MSRDSRYSEEVLRRLRELPGGGSVAGSGVLVVGRAGSVNEGAEVELEFSLRDGRVAAAAFRAYGCPHLLAGASWLTERAVGWQRQQALDWDWREAAEALAVPPYKHGRLLKIQDALRDAAGNWPQAPGSTV